VSSSNSVGVKSDMVEMLNVGEEGAGIRSLKGASDGGSASRKTEGYPILRRTEGWISILIGIGRSWGEKAMGVSASAGVSAAIVSSPPPSGS